MLYENMGVVKHSSYRVAIEEKELLEAFIKVDDTHYRLLLTDEKDQRGRYVHRFAAEIIPHEEKPVSLRVSFYTAKDTDTPTLIYEDKNPLYVKNEVIRAELENVVMIEMEGIDCSFDVGTITVDNSFSWNTTLFLFFLVAGGLLFHGLGQVLDCVINIVKKREMAADSSVFANGFLAVCLLFGIIMCMALPLNKVGNDEETHLQAVMQLASFPSGELHISESIANQISVTEFNNPDAQPMGLIEQAEFNEALSKDGDYKTGIHSLRFYLMGSRVPAYLSMAAAMKIGKGLSLPWVVICIMVRLANLFTYALIMYLAIRVLPKGRALMAVIGLLPQNIFLASTCSYDPFVTACMCAGVAFFVRLTEEFKVKYVALMILFMFLSCLIKAVYAPMLLLGFMLPRETFKNKQQRAYFYVAILFAFIITILLFIMPTVIAPSESGDTRGTEAVSEVSQIGFILGNPFTYAGILLSQMVRWIPQCFIGPDCTTFMGHLVNGSTEFKGYFVPVFLVIVTLLLAGIAVKVINKNNGGLNMIQRGWGLFMCFGASVLVWTSMYVAFTAPGAREIAGVQGRYFIPLFFPVYYMLGADVPAGELTGRLAPLRPLWYHILLEITAIILAMSVWTSVISRYCI
ncbi:MAG: DUF2142 domain-containing protein [Eubacteriales bacterium]|nr:DUF2142 domain-containing protein [Eubacteriales bacterium]